MLIYIYIYIYIHTYVCKGPRLSDPLATQRPAAETKAACDRGLSLIQRELRGSQGMGVVRNKWFDCGLLSILCPNTHVYRCSNPLPCDPLSSP